MRHGSLFSGIGGFDLAAEWMGWENVFHCEWMEFPRKVLDYYFPNADSHIDICKTDFKQYEGTIEIISGGFPCQPFSTAGKRKGKDDERYLWHEMLRAIQEIKPKYVIAENVLGITNIDGGMVFEQVCFDLENEGYEVQAYIIPAASKNAPHRRDRCWFIAYANGTEQGNNRRTNIEKETKIWRDETCNVFGKLCSNGVIANTSKIGFSSKMENGKLEGGRFRISNQRTTWDAFPTESPICGRNDGLPTKLDGITFSNWKKESIKGYGNAIVPQVALELFKIIEEFENSTK